MMRLELIATLMPCPVSLTVNGMRHALSLDPRVSLLDVLREQLDLTGTKKGCDQGQCGACTVLVDGRRVVSCLTLAVMKDGSSVTTIEGLAKDGSLHPLAAGLHRSRCIPMRLLHVGPDLFSRGPDCRRQGEDSLRNPRVDERQYLPMRRLHQHRGGDPAGDEAINDRLSVFARLPMLPTRCARSLQRLRRNSSPAAPTWSI